MMRLSDVVVRSITISGIAAADSVSLACFSPCHVLVALRISAMMSVGHRGLRAINMSNVRNLSPFDKKADTRIGLVAERHPRIGIAVSSLTKMLLP